MNNLPFSIYVHIPFCVHRCAYCDFNTYAGLEDSIPEYVQALSNEIRLAGKAAAVYLDQPANVHTIFFGGGTPSLLSSEQFRSIFEAINEFFNLLPDVEITLEANPGTIDQKYLIRLKESGINRLSLGMQSAHPDDLRILDRQHRLEDVVRSVHWSRQAGIDNVNLDLIFGIPHQSMDSWRRTLAMALSLEPDHLSLYALTLEHGTPMAQWISRGLLPEPDQDLAADMYEFAMQHLEQAGFSQYEISNWARVDKNGVVRSCRHNLQYWRLLPYLGFGAGAHGFAVGKRTANVLSPAAYMQRIQNGMHQQFVFPQTSATSDYISVDHQAEMGEMMMMGLRLVQEGVPEANFIGRFGQAFEQVYGKQIRNLIQSGLLEWAEDPAAGRALRLTKPGRLLGNRVFREFI